MQGHAAFLCALLGLLPLLGHGQQDSNAMRLDTAGRARVVASQPDSTKPVKRWPVPRRAAISSLILPGLGQAYIRQWWKLPIVYGLLGLTGYFVVDNQRVYDEYNGAVIIKQEIAIATATGVPYTGAADPYPNVSLTGMTNARNAARSNRDLAVFWTIIVYSANVLDAYVSAHLKHFNVSDDLSLHIAPAMQPAHPMAMGSVGLGARVSLTFK